LFAAAGAVSGGKPRAVWPQLATRFPKSCAPPAVRLSFSFLQRDAAPLLVAKIARQVRASRLVVGDRRLHRLDVRCERAAGIQAQLAVDPIEKIERTSQFGVLDGDIWKLRTSPSKTSPANTTKRHSSAIASAIRLSNASRDAVSTR
jgi:hypothetical protein